MTEALLLGIAAVFMLGIGAQWLAWRFRLPSILLLLVFGFLAGPVTGLLSQEALQGGWLFPVVSLAVGIILFEGGLTLRFGELREVGIPAEVSHYAGTYLCNAAHYLSHYHGTPATFLHLPLATEHVLAEGGNQPSLPLETLVRGVLQIVHLARQVQQVK